MVSLCRAHDFILSHYSEFLPESKLSVSFLKELPISNMYKCLFRIFSLHFAKIIVSGNPENCAWPHRNADLLYTFQKRQKSIDRLSLPYGSRTAMLFFGIPLLRIFNVLLTGASIVKTIPAPCLVILLL